MPTTNSKLPRDADPAQRVVLADKLPKFVPARTDRSAVEALAKATPDDLLMRCVLAAIEAYDLVGHAHDAADQSMMFAAELARRAKSDPAALVVNARHVFSVDEEVNSTVFLVSGRPTSFNRPDEVLDEVVDHVCNCEAHQAALAVLRHAGFEPTFVQTERGPTA